MTEEFSTWPTLVATDIKAGVARYCDKPAFRNTLEC